MNIIEFAEERFAQLTNEMVVIGTDDLSPVARLAANLNVISASLKKLRAFMETEPFTNRQEEIRFFKHTKPRFYSLKIYHFELYNLDTAKPAGTKDMLLDYYLQELKLVQRFFKLNAFLYQYFKGGFTELDNLYFVRGAEIPTILIPEQPETDQAYSTSMDYQFAKFIAFEMLQTEILNRIGGLDGTLLPVEPKKPKPVPVLKWTGSHVNIVELIYGLYYTLQLNNGNADVTEIVALMEETFGITLRDAHHSFVEIRRRKVDSPSRFLEQMAAAIKQRVDDDLEYKPKLKKALKAQKDSD